MKDYSVSYYLGEMYHCYIVESKDEAAAIRQVLSRLSNPGMLHDFKIERHFSEWN